MSKRGIALDHPQEIGNDAPLLLLDPVNAIDEEDCRPARGNLGKEIDSLLSEIRKIGPDLNGHRVLLRVNPDIARALKEEESAVLRDLKQAIGKDVQIRPDTQMHHEQFDVMAI